MTIPPCVLSLVRRVREFTIVAVFVPAVIVISLSMLAIGSVVDGWVWLKSKS
jgi:hypothetical protein